MEFVFAFITCGILCVIAQALFTFAHLNPPQILNLFLALGGLLSPCGFMAWLTAVGQGGANVIISGAGNAFETAATLTMTGNPAMLIIVSLMFFATICIGIALGEVRHCATRRASSKSDSPTQLKHEGI